jgi:DNA-binding response OmpR family regulator
LIVDDDDQSLRAVRALLAAYGFKGICASSGAEAHVAARAAGE